jgi:hypothetical protein
LSKAASLMACPVCNGRQVDVAMALISGRNREH